MECEATLAVLERMLLDESVEPFDLSISVLKMITKDFSSDQEIGHGGFAVVYKGYLRNGRTVAVKKLNSSFDMDETKYNREVGCLMRVRHKNIVRFLGYCADTHGKMMDYNGKFVMADVRERLLCFEYMRKGSLRDYIKDVSCGLKWRTCYRIIKGICEGLNYLHAKNIIHLDLKPANILLDDNMEPKISDFGLSRWFHENPSSTIITSKLFGSMGYVAPEFYSGVISLKSDIYSLGVIFMEILTGKKGYSTIENVLKSWMKRLDMSSAETELEQVRVCAQISIDCMNLDPDKRPAIQHIILMLGETESMELLCTNELTEEPKLMEEYISSERTNNVIKPGIRTPLVPQSHQRKVFINISSNQWGHVGSEHPPMTFDRLAMDPEVKQKVMDDLNTFVHGKDYYARIGKAWMRIYLLYGPPGTGKSSMIAAMANYLEYNIYTMELTWVHSNADLRKLFFETKSKSIVVFEDIDSLMNFRIRRNKKTEKDNDIDKMVVETPDGAMANEMDTSSQSMPLSVSSLLNMMRLLSLCVSEMVIVFTANYLEKMEPALIRNLDMVIEMSYCTFEMFKFLAKIYLSVESHELFDTIRDLLQEVSMSSAEVTEYLTLRSANEDVDSCLTRLVVVLQLYKDRRSV